MSFTVPCLKKHHAAQIQESLIRLSSDNLRWVVSAFESICGELFYKMQSPGPHPDPLDHQMGLSGAWESVFHLDTQQLSSTLRMRNMPLSLPFTLWRG